MTATPFVSIVILTYNNPPILRRCIESSLGLDYPAKEVIVVDNASTDDTARMVREEFQDRVKLVVRERNSPVAARNEGYREARGEFVLSLDHDMVIADSRILYRAVELFRAFPDVALLSAKICGEEDPDRPLDEHWFHPLPVEAKDLYFFTTYFAEGAAVFRAEALRAAGGYDESFFHAGENLDMAMKLVDLGWRLLYTPSLSTIELVVNLDLWRRPSRGNYYQLRNRLWVAWKYYPLLKAVAYALPRIVMAGVRSVRFGWFGHFLAGLRDGIFAPAVIRRQRRPLRPERWAEIRRLDGVTVTPPVGHFQDAPQGSARQA